jgi:hypothetical protein
MLFYKLDADLWSTMKTFIVFLNKLPDFPYCQIHDLPLDEYCLEEIKRLQDGKN